MIQVFIQTKIQKQRKPIQIDNSLSLFQGSDQHDSYCNKNDTEVNDQNLGMSLPVAINLVGMSSTFLSCVEQNSKEYLQLATIILSFT